MPDVTIESDRKKRERERERERGEKRKMGKMKNATTGRGDSRCAGYYNVHRERGYREFYERFYCRDQSRSFLMDRIGYRGVEGGG